jgi:hypothetical protein
MRESPTKILATGADPAADTEHEVTLGADGDGRVYHIKSIYMPTAIDTGASDVAFQITDASDAIIWSGSSLTQIQIGSFSLQAHRGIAAGFTDGDGGEVMVLPDKMIVPGGYKVKTLSETVANVDHGVLTIFGSVFKAL